MTLIYFIKTEYTGNVYKVSDFYNSNGSFLKPANRSMAVDMRFNDGKTILETQRGLPDGSDLHDYTHIIVPDKQKVYTISAIDDLNADSYKLYLDDEPLMGNYQEMKAKDMLITVSNDPDLFIGTNTVLDISTEKTATLHADSSSTNATGTWVLFTFQKDVNNLEFEIGEIADYTSVGTFESKSTLESAYPRVDTTVPFDVPFYLKFANVTSTNELYQAVYSDEDGPGVSWVAVHKNPTFTWLNGFTRMTKAKYTSGIKISNLGDLSTVQVAFPIDSTLVVKRKLNTTASTLDDYFSVPSFNSIKSWNNVDKLLSIKLVPQELLGIEEIERADVKRITRVDIDLNNVLSAVKTTDTYLGKEIFDGYLHTELLVQSVQSNQPNITMTTVKQFKDIFEFNNWSYLVDSPIDYEPFKTYYLYFFGEIIPIPGKYLQSGFSVRLVVTSTDVLYEVYTDKMNIIGSGRLMWFTRYNVDQVSLFEANNPTYKEQFMVNQFKTMLLGTGAGILKGGAPGAALGFGASLGAVAWQSVDLMYQEKSRRFRAEEAFGQNDTALTNIKGFGTYIVVIEPDANSLAQMTNAHEITGFSVNTRKSLNNVPWVTNTL